MGVAVLRVTSELGKFWSRGFLPFASSATAHLPIHEAQAPPTIFGWSGTIQEMRDAVAAQAYREEARVQEYYAANEAAAEIAAGFDPGFASAIYASFGVGDAAVGRAPWLGWAGGGGGGGGMGGGGG